MQIVSALKNFLFSEMFRIFLIFLIYCILGKFNISMISLKRISFD